MKGALLAGVLVACGSSVPQERERYLEAMELLARDPEGAWQRCARLELTDLADDCGLSALEALADEENMTSDELLRRCAVLSSQEARDECAFQVGERRDDPTACARAGDFTDDCRLHLLTRAMPRWLPPEVGPGDPAVLTAMAAEVRRVGLPEGDLRAASATFRALLERQPLLDRGACQALASPWREACWHTGLAVYEDRLNRARDLGPLPCPGAALPRPLAHSADPELDVALARRALSVPCGEGGAQ